LAANLKAALTPTAGSAMVKTLIGLFHPLSICSLFTFMLILLWNVLAMCHPLTYRLCLMTQIINPAASPYISAVIARQEFLLANLDLRGL
jgi:hypothetical protein